MNFKKKFVSFLLISSSIIVTSSALVFGATLGSVIGDNVNVRAESNTKSSVITKYNVGQAVDIVGEENGFYEIMVDGANLYISTDYIEVLKAEATISGSNVNVRDSASMDAQIIGKFSGGENVTVIGTEGQWTKIEYNGSAAYISSDFVKGDFINNTQSNAAPVIEEDFVQMDSTPKNMAADTMYAVVSSDTGLRLRSDASTDSKVLTLVPSGEAVNVINQKAEWVQVSYAGYEGYLSQEFVQIGYGAKPVNTGGLGQQVVEYGKQFLGTPYVWAGNDLNNGVDCSGFVYNVFKKFGIGLNRSSSAMVSNGVHVEKGNLQVGDLVLFDTTGDNDGGISHVGIYMGDGNFIHSSSSKRTWGVVISSLNEEYYIRTYVTARRVL